ncbi:MAG: hypothetical protein NVSMB25_22830 [Thermoleophilaceae bacterium]
MPFLIAAVAALTLLVAAASLAAGFGFLLAWGARGSGNGAFKGPDNLAVDTRGDVYVADRDNNRIQEFSSAGGFLRRFGRNGGDGSAGRGNGEFNRPRGVTTDGFGNVYVADSRNNRIKKFAPGGALLMRIGRNGGDGSAGSGNGEFSDPRGMATDAVGDFFVADHGNNRIQKFSPDGVFLARLGRNGGDGSPGAGPGEFRQPRGLAIDGDGDIYVADKSNNRIQKLSHPAGSWLGGAGMAAMAAPEPLPASFASPTASPSTGTGTSTSPTRATTEFRDFRLPARSYRCSVGAGATARPAPVPASSGPRTASRPTVAQTCSSPTRATTACRSSVIRRAPPRTARRGWNCAPRRPGCCASAGLS